MNNELQDMLADVQKNKNLTTDDVRLEVARRLIEKFPREDRRINSLIQTLQDTIQNIQEEWSEMHADDLEPVV